MRRLAISLLMSTCVAVPAWADDEAIKSAELAGPASIASAATIRDWEGNVLREGSNGWVCLPDRPDTGGNPDPWCVNGAWENFLNAFIAGDAPSYTTMGIAYMLAGDSPVSNTDPAATGPTEDNDWITALGAHLMIVVPGENSLAGYSADPTNGGPWIMWPGTPYEHLMVPIEGPPTMAH